MQKLYGKIEIQKWNSWVQIHEFRVRTQELRSRIHELRVPIHELRAQIHKSLNE